ncbi:MULTISPECIES: putative holin-like toxin [Weissella]|uniref:Holin-like toxin n=1 Tax=Weissella fermenti TaxID=2987699 RepID=A0ABT6D5E4_9LACO|nr:MULTISPECIES: putative holin-like toxin [Weissella]MCW0928037.1 putative holin-like toxin [Weissella sp. LMG 11983]MDF9300627.1 putative holin-like toxin [Weissella sp. BK2]
MSVADALSLMVAFATFLVSLLSYIDKHNKK